MYACVLYIDGFYSSNIPSRKYKKRDKEFPSLPPLPSYESSKHEEEMPHIIDPRTPEITAVDGGKRFVFSSTNIDGQPKRNSASYHSFIHFCVCDFV